MRAAGLEREGAEVTQRYAEVVERVRAMNLGRSVSFVRSADGGSFRIEGTGAFPGSVADEAGIEVADGPAGAQEEENSGFVELSGERLRAVDGDIIVSAAYAGEAPQVEELATNPTAPAAPSCPSPP